jgi:hypothetical protein
MKYFALIICLFLFACKKTDNAIIENPQQTATIPINNCNTFTANTNFSICYDSLLFDNRCPDLAMCVRRGEVGVKLSFKQNNMNIPFKLADFPNLLGNFPSDTTINGIHIKLIDVLQHPFSNQNAEKKVVLEIN